MKCAQCHTGLDQHGGTRLTSAKACQDCHHGQAKPTDCVNCHRGVGTSGKGILNLDGAPFPHGAHQQAMPTCAPCHSPPAMAAAKVECASCHQQHHRVTDRACAACHQGDIKGKHGGLAAEVHAAEPPCAACHEAAQELTQWTWQTCASCHTDQKSGHYEKSARGPRGCEACHDLKIIKE
jgi:hypothetical protein